MDGWNVGLCKGVRRSVFCMVCTYRLIVEGYVQEVCAELVGLSSDV